jgi:hypothetical protein
LGYLSPPPSPAPVIVVKDVGGLVSDYEQQTEIYRRENREVRLHECRSACTIALSLPNVCVYPDAKIKFHQAYNAITREVDQSVSTRLFGYYPEAVQGRLDHLTREYRVLSGTELIALGVRNCNGDDKIMIAANTKKQQPPAPATAPVPASPLKDVAQSVQTAIAGALQRGEDASRAPIRVVVADRTVVNPNIGRLFSDGTPPAPPAKPDLAVASAPEALAPFAAEIPLPPRRPPSTAMTTQDAEPAPARLQLIAGAKEIVTNTQFMPRTPVEQKTAAK